MATRFDLGNDPLGKAIPWGTNVKPPVDPKKQMDKIKENNRIYSGAAAEVLNSVFDGNVPQACGGPDGPVSADWNPRDLNQIATNTGIWGDQHANPDCLSYMQNNNISKIPEDNWPRLGN